MSQIIRIFIASPSDVSEERRIAEDVIKDLSVKLERLYDCALISKKWEQFATLTTVKPGETPQDLIMPGVRNSHILVAILYKRYGTPAHPPSLLSGTEEEINAALEHRDHIKILTYFHTLKAAERRMGGARKVVEMRQRLERSGVGTKDYRNAFDFQQKLLLDLTEVAISGLPDWHYRDELSRFFLLGQSDTMDNKRVLICYPPIHRHDPGGIQANSDWHTRLVPNVVYEDVKAIQRIEACIRKIGVRDVKAVTTLASEVYETDYNFIWLCLPRNRLAQRRHAQYDKHCRIKLQENKDNRFDILWHQPDGKVVHVRSPLARYLQERGPDAKDSVWKNEYSDIVARDFGVISRFEYTPGAGGRAPSDHPFWEYFIFGIRGLGTWGAAWFIHHKADKLAEIVASQGYHNIQILVQVTYHRHRITQVVDVSNEPQEYFDSQNSEATIVSVMDEHR